MLTGAFPPATAIQQQQQQHQLNTNNATLAINGNLKDDRQFVTFETATVKNTTKTTTTTDTMTKQLTTNSATTISNGNLAPTSAGSGSSGGLSPLASPASNASSPHSSGSGALRKTAPLCAKSTANIVTATTATAAATMASLAAPTTIITATTTPPPAAVTAAASASNAANDASGRSAALERAYVHDVYENCEEPTGPIRPRVAQFLSNLDPGSVVCDVGCGSGRYLTQCNPAICTIGVDRCYRLSKVAREKGGEVALCDNLELPFRDESFDAVLSLAVVHHFATTERRVSALRELARILRIGGRVVITVWALEQRHRRFESQDVLIPWQPPKNRNFSYSDEEDDDSFLPPYHAYTEDSTNSSRSAGDGDSSSLSSSSPGESCYSFVRRAIQKLAGGRKHPWFLDSWTSKDTKNDSSLDYEDAKDLPIELRRLEDFEDFTDPPLSAGLKSRSLGSILNPPPRQIVRSRSSVPSLGGPLLHMEPPNYKAVATSPNAQFLSALDSYGGAASVSTANGHSPSGGLTLSNVGGVAAKTASLGRRPKLIKQKQSLCDEDYQLPENPFHMISSYNSSSNSVSSSLYLRSGCYYNSTQLASAAGGGGANYHHHAGNHSTPLSAKQMVQASIFLRKQSSLNEELMAGNRIREKERVRKRIQKQMSLNEAFLCRSALFSKRLQVIREGFASKIKTSTGSLERATKNGLTKIMQNFKTHASTANAETESTAVASGMCNGGPQGQSQSQKCPKHQHYHHHHHHYHYQQQQQQQLTQSFHLAHHHQSQSVTANGAHYPYSAMASMHKQMSLGSKFSGPVTYCNSPDCSSNACYCSTYHHVGCSGCCATDGECQEVKARRHSRESGSDSSKDSSLQSDTSIESEDSFASVIFIPKPEQHQQQQQLNYQKQHQNSNSSSSNSSSSNGGSAAQHTCCSCVSHINGHQHQQQTHHAAHQQRAPSLPTSPLIMPCPPTPAHSPAAAQAAITSPPQTVAAVTAAMAILTPPSAKTAAEDLAATGSEEELSQQQQRTQAVKSRFNFDEAIIKQHESQQHQQREQQDKLQTITEARPVAASTTATAAATTINSTTTTSSSISSNSSSVKITRQSIRDLPPIPKFRKQQSLQLHRQSFPIVRRSSATTSSAAAIAIPNIPKLLSLELFNPATDDLDSDSSEASSPDSIDSVISAAKTVETAESAEKVESTAEPPTPMENPSTAEAEADRDLKPQLCCNGELNINLATPHDIILNDDSCHLLPSHSNEPHPPASKKQQDCAEFAEKLSAQLLRELEDKNNHVECRSLDGIGDIADYLEESGSEGHKKRNGELRDLSTLREELRERRLMLANLSTQPSMQQSPTSSSSSLSSQTRSFTIHEENEEENDERSYTLQLYENCKISKFNYKRNRPYNLNPETAYLLQDDGDIFDEEDEDELDEEKASNGDKRSIYARKNSHNTIRCDSWDEGQDVEELTHEDEEADKRNKRGQNGHKQSQRQQPQTHTLQNRESNGSWENSNSSTNSLDSPSQGGATTHHRYYHVFREGELDALINHHVSSLHIVSSHYERASWCVVAEKVQVWTI